VASADEVTGERFTVYACAGCEVAFTWPQPRDLARYYPPDYRAFSPRVERTLRFLYRAKVEGWLARFEAPGRALEIGCGPGWILKTLARHGWTVVGVERGDEQARQTARVTGLDVSGGPIERIGPDASFDLIVMFQVLEHVTDPLGMLAQCRRLLRPGGVLIVSCPNFASWGAAFGGSHWFHLDVPRHLFHFSPGSLGAYLRREGWRVERTSFVSWIHDPYGWVQTQMNRLGFGRNRLSRALRRGARSVPAGGLLWIVALLLAGPAVVLSMASWLLRTGAIFELHARKTVS
jgi:SAM-dependent methyltransferase